MKAGIVTFTDGTNFGQRLQNYAVQEFLKSYGFEVFTFKLRRPDYSIYSSLKRSIKSLLGFIDFIQERKRKSCFQEFNNQFIRFWPTTIYNDMDFSTINNYFDMVVAGSDQVWNPLSAWVSKLNFLIFADKTKRVSIAASFSVDSIPESQKESYREYLNKMRFITVREDQAASIISELCGKMVSVILDPTLFYDATYWRIREKKPQRRIPNNYILSYFLGKVDNTEYLSKLAISQGKELIDLSKGNGWYDIGPSEFLYLIDNADFVYTDSYHGSIFSILFHKQFKNCARQGQPFSMNSRFETLYGKLGIHMDFDSFEGFALDSEIEYDVIDKKLEAERRKTLIVLEKIISSFENNANA